jgi:hypothetical protein
MARPVTLTIVAAVLPGRAAGLERVLAEMGDGVANDRAVAFAALAGVHFARFMLVGEATDLRGAPLPASLVYMSDLDVPRARHLAELVDTSSAQLDRLLEHCDGYPDAESRTAELRLEYLRAHVVREQARYVNTTGRTATQVHAEDRLRDALETYLDATVDRGATVGALELRERLRAFVAHDPALAALRKRPARPDLAFRLRELVHRIAIPLLLLVLAPLLLVAAPFYLVALRLHERRDPAPHLRPPPERVRELAALEDHLVHNPFAAVGLVKAGAFRHATAVVVLAGIDYAARHVFNAGDLAGVKTIHFARWVFLDGGRRVLFASTYDGSLESYMDDFIDKIAWGLNIVFSNGYGYPRTRFLVLDGAHDEIAFKDYLRLHQVPVRVWYSAYGRLTNANIENTARIRAGLRGAAGEEGARAWLQAL